MGWNTSLWLIWWCGCLYISLTTWKKLIAKNKTPNHNNTTTQKMGNIHISQSTNTNNLFKHSNLNIALRATNTIHQQLTDKIARTGTNSSGIYKLKHNTCNNSYVGQSGRSIPTRHKEHTRHIGTNNPISACALHILNNRQEYGTTEETLELLKPCNKGTRMNFGETLFMQAFYQRNILIEEQQVNDIYTLYELPNTSRGQMRVP